MNIEEKGIMLEFLKELEFSEEEILNTRRNTTEPIVQTLETKKEVVKDNIVFLKDLGVGNYKEVFINFAHMFLQDRSVFQGIFNKYDKEDLIQKIANNVLIVEHL